MPSIRDDENRRLGFDQREADVERWAAIDRAIEMTPVVGEPVRSSPPVGTAGSPETAPTDRAEEAT